ncbi:MAG: hypothetical protein GY717_01440 [Rhodobacteraceae bacterium]|nr:hypothetical protein [Paracoccaceae bacterium]
MKNTILAGVIVLVAGAASAGGYSDPVVETYVAPQIIETETVRSSGSDEWAGIMLAFLTIVVLGAGVLN